MIHAAEYIAMYAVLTAYFIHRCWVPSPADVACSMAAAAALVTAVFIITTAIEMVTQ